jgi:hypothetical protein
MFLCRQSRHREDCFSKVKTHPENCSVCPDSIRKPRKNSPTISVYFIPKLIIPLASSKNCCKRMPQIFRSNSALLEMNSSSLMIRQQTVFVKYGDSGKWLDELRRIGPKRLNIRKLQRFTVNLSKRDFEKTKVDGLVEEIWPGFWLWIGRYDPDHGPDLFGRGWAPEDLMV